LISEILRISIEKIQIPFKSDKNNATLHEDQYTFWIISRSILLRVINFSDKICRGHQNKHFMFSNFLHRQSCRLWDNVKKTL